MTTPDKSLTAYFTEQHREADGLWAELENAASKREAAQVPDLFRRFDRSVRQHLQLEEEVLFPSFEAATGMTQGPTTVMRAEHRQMRGVLDQMQAAVDAGQGEALLDLGDTLFTLMQQHNMKEEGMLYRMSEQALGESWPELHERARAYK